jgi:hypothetical protein
MSRCELLPAAGTGRRRVGSANAPGPLTVLIEVPEVRVVRARSSRRFSINDPRRTRGAAGRPRRRLRREARFAAYALLGIAPFIFCGGPLLWTLASRPAGLAVLETAERGAGWGTTRAHLRSDTTHALRAPDEPGAAIALASAVVLPIEPVVAAASSEAEEAVVFPGYLLPADGLQESGHEGN